MKYCTKCGAQIADDDDYCYFCGNKLNIEEKDEKEELKFSEQKDDEFYYQSERKNGLAIAGFVVAFFSPIVGLILSIIGLNKSKDMKGEGRGMAIAGIIIAIMTFVVSFIIYFIAFEGIFTE